jgi:Leucine-rich repeat (LRR) protein
LDDIWSPIDLINEVGVRFGDDNPSKIIISSRKKEVIGRMGAIEYCLKIQPLSTEEGWELFRRRAFTNGVVTDSNIEEAIAKEIAAECKGLPLAINAVAAALSWKKTNDEWSRALIMMKNADPSFPITHDTIDAELYQKVRWSYDDLPHPNLKICFLYCAAFPEDAYIDVERLVQIWSGEGLVSPRGTTNFMDIGRDNINVLVSRCLVEYSEDDGHEYLKVHDVLRDMAIYVGQKEEKWLFAAGQHLQNFPSEEQTRDCKRISIIGNDIHDLPTDFKCPNLVSLMLAQNRSLKKVPEGFLSNLTCVRVLDLSHTSISSLPTSVGQLGQLEFLDLSFCYDLQDLPDSICNLSRLQFLNLEFCGVLHSLPSGIGELTNLKHLDLKGCDSLVTIPHGIFQLTSLNKLVLPWACTVRAGDLANLSNLSNLMELHATVKAEIDTMGPWLDMRVLKLKYKHDADTNGDDVVEDILPESIKHMQKLEALTLFDYEGLSLPNCICEFQNMKSLSLSRCRQLRELPALEIGSESAHASFPMLERLELDSLDKLESIAGPSNVLNEKAMPQLKWLQISHCPFAKKLISATEKLPNLTQVEIWDCNELTELDFGSESFQMLKYLDLSGLNKLESIGGSLNIWNEGTLPKLQELSIQSCSWLRKLPLGMEKLSNLKIIMGELDWWQRIRWKDNEMKINLSQLFREGY